MIHFRKQFTVSTALWENLKDDLNIMFTALREFLGVTLYIAMYTVSISEHFKVCYGALKVRISLHRFHVFAVKLLVTSLPAQVKKCWGSICFLVCLPAGNQSCDVRSWNTVTPHWKMCQGNFTRSISQWTHNTIIHSRFETATATIHSSK